MKLLLILVFSLSSTLMMAQLDSLQSYYDRSVSAYELQDYSTFLTYTKLADNLRPNHPTLAYNVASAYALTGNYEQALISLRNYIGMHASDKFFKDPDFKSMENQPGFLDLKNLIAEKTRTIQQSKVKIELDQDSIHFESITWYERAFFLGGVHSRTIYWSHENGQGVFATYSDYPHLYAIMGLDVDTDQDILWVCTAALPQMKDYSEALHKETSSIMAFDLKNGKMLKSYRVDQAQLGDITVSEQGKAIASDGLNNRLYQVDLYQVEVLKELKTLNLQGIAWDKGNNRLYFSDYLTGLYSMSLKTMRVSKMDSKNLYSNKGIDGLLFRNNQLVAFQNGTEPKRTISIQLNNKGTEVENVSILDQNLEGRGEPTQGVIIQETLYYLSNSPWDAYDQDVLNPEKVDLLKIRSIPLSNLKQ